MGQPSNPSSGAERGSGSGALVCHACGRTVACAADEIYLYTVMGWPLCCGETMALHTGAVHPGVSFDELG